MTVNKTVIMERDIQGGSNMTGIDLCVRLYKSVPVIFEPPCTNFNILNPAYFNIWYLMLKTAYGMTTYIVSLVF